MNSTRKHRNRKKNGHSANETSNKKQRSERREEEFFLDVENIPLRPQPHPLPPKLPGKEDFLYYQTEAYQKYEHAMNKIKQYLAKLKKSLVHAVRIGNVKFVEDLLNDPVKRKDLSIRQNKRTVSYDPYIGWLEPPKETNLGLGNMLCFDLNNCNLLAEACKKGDLSMVSKLLELGFDINNSSININNGFVITPLMEAIKHGQVEMVRFLLSQPNIISTRRETNIVRTNNNRNRVRCNPTPLSVASERGMHEVVQMLIQAGALDQNSTRRPDDPDPDSFGCQYGPIELVQLSLHEAIYEAFNGAKGYFCDFSNVSKEVYCCILETLLFHSGSHSVPVIDKQMSVIRLIFLGIQHNEWRNCRRIGGFDYEIGLDFDIENRWLPSGLAMAVARGLRYMSPECIHASGIKLSKEGLERIQSKKEEWKRITSVASEKLNQKDEGDIYPRANMLCWCHLFHGTSQPWSRYNYKLFPQPIRALARELLRIGSLLALTHNSSFLKEIWEREIMPSVLS